LEKPCLTTVPIGEVASQLGEMMIAVRLIGGLGNQMFQYAAARALADRLGVELVFDIRAFDSYPLFGYGLDSFCVRGRLATPVELARWPTWMRRPYQLIQRLGVVTRWYSEPGFNYDPAWPTIDDNVLLDGYFQSEKYFSPIAASLRDDFALSQSLSPEMTEISELAHEANSVMIHVRRGDYVNNAKTLKVHGVCSPSYYEAAIEFMSQRLSRPRFFVFSDDIVWAKKNLKLGSNTLFVVGNYNDPAIDIHLMAKCRHHIIANSSFSWWGAWLGQNEEQVVVAPSPWFNKSKMNARDLMIDGWHFLSRS
jgi:hypothetical protein